MPAVDPPAELPQARGLDVQVVQRRAVGHDQVVRPKAGNGGDLGVDLLRLGIVGHAEADRVVIDDRLEIAVLRRPVDAMPRAVRVEVLDEIPFAGR